MDHTALFRASVKAMRVRKRHLVVEQRRSEHVPSNFALKAAELRRDISQLRDFLIKYRKDYINVSHLATSACTLSDLDRDRIDADAETAIKACNKMIGQLTQFVGVEKGSPATRRHREAVTQILDAYLKAVCKIYSEQRAVRVKKAADMRRLARLSSLLSTARPLPRPTPPPPPEDDAVAPPPTVDAEPQLRKRRASHEARPGTEQAKRAAEAADGEAQSELGEEERVQLTKENDELYRQANAVVADIEQLEGRVVEIARLQDVFSEKVLQQDSDIYRINDVAIHTTEDIRSGNEQIREAMKHKAGMRIYILFFLLVLTFTLLFLDWYND